MPDQNTDLPKNILSKICKEFKIEKSQRLKNTYKIYTPFCFNDGDHLYLLLQKEKDLWMLSDNTETLMRASYDKYIDDIVDEKKTEIQSILTMFDVTLSKKDGQIRAIVENKKSSISFYNIIQAILHIYFVVSTA